MFQILERNFRNQIFFTLFLSKSDVFGILKKWKDIHCPVYFQSTSACVIIYKAD